MLMSHVDNARLYRILFYDCPPLEKKAHNPITGKCIDFGKSKQASFRHEFHNELKKRRKVALRLGYLKDNGGWIISPPKTKQLLKGSCAIDDLTEYDVTFDIRQKGVDIKMAPQGYLWVKSPLFGSRTPCGQAVDFNPPSLAG